ncbi:MAG: thiosulfate oxidation carrier complex protein SoxZ [Thiolinea sp.]
MARKIKIKAKAKDGVVTVKSIMNHPMETGQRKGKDGKKIPAHYISEIVVTANDKEVLNANWGPSVSKNPYLSFAYKGEKGDAVKLTWKDNMGESESAETEAK